MGGLPLSRGDRPSPRPEPDFLATARGDTTKPQEALVGARHGHVTPAEACPRGNYPHTWAQTARGCLYLAPAAVPTRPSDLAELSGARLREKMIYLIGMTSMKMGD